MQCLVTTAAQPTREPEAQPVEAPAPAPAPNEGASAQVTAEGPQSAGEAPVPVPQADSAEVKSEPVSSSRSTQGPWWAFWRPSWWLTNLQGE